ncbi:XK-related protein 8-like [Silurus meridionalis]|uniref:XK-related protein 8-like n=1 Tax=Silurus meridionalis TaxID=175797 RepID=UPI001EE9E115|nr:XK-related protein 8-like [Silurus meridionalis]
MINFQAYAMEEGFPLNFLQSAVRFSVLSLLLFLVDIALDLWAIVSFYEEQKYFSMGLLVCILLSSSVLLQIYSWIWYTDSSKNIKTNVEEFISRPWLMNIVHIFQLGVFTRFAAVIEISSNRCKLGEPLKKRLSVYLNQDLSMLRLFEAFSESAPQLVLMVTLIMEMPELHFFTVIKIFASLSSISITMLSYHCFMLSFLFEKFKMGWISSIIYFLWNLLLIGSRIVCVSLFASVLPCYIAAHFLSLWMLLFSGPGGRTQTSWTLNLENGCTEPL